MDVCLFLNHACNLACTYCYNGRKFHRAMSEEVMRKGVDLAFHGSCARLSFFGGEPLLERELLTKAVRYAREKERALKKIPLRFSMTTNGTLIDAAFLDLMKREQFHLVFSLDGCRDSHERTRPYENGASSFDTVVENLEQAMAQMPAVETITVIDPANVDTLPESFSFLMDLGVRNLNFSLNYEADWQDDDLGRLENALDELGDRYVDHYRNETDFAFDLFDSKIITHLKGGYACRDRCKFGHEELCVAPSGNLYPCERLVGEDTRTDVTIGTVQSGVDLEKVMHLKQRKDRPDKECESCKLQNRCMFWCGCVNYALTGDVGKTSGLLCAMEQLSIAAADKAAGTLYKEQNPLFIRKFYAV